MTNDNDRNIEKSSTSKSGQPQNSQRRNFIKTSTMAMTAAAMGPYVVGQNVQASIAAGNAEVKPLLFNPEDYRNGPERSIIGYCWPWTARPGETVDFKVSTYGDKTNLPYQADLVRVYCTNVLPLPEMKKEVEVQAPFTGQYSGRHQSTNPGSYVEIPAARALDKLGSFTLQTYICPTLLPARGQKLLRYPEVIESFKDSILPTLEDTIGDQTLVARWDEQKKTGWSFYINQDNQLSFKVGDGAAVHTINMKQALIQDRWFLATVRYDADKNTLEIDADYIDWAALKESAWFGDAATLRLPADFRLTHRGPLRFGAVTDGSGSGKRLKSAQVLNGKLDAVRLTHGVQSTDAIDELAGVAIPKALTGKVIGFWDFAKGIGTTRVHDLSRNNLHGVTVNLPSRGVVGVRWDGTSKDWRSQPDHYSACYFHDDDLYDAEWDTDFSYKLPGNLPSGMYAARLTHGDFIEHIMFFVAPEKHKPTAKAAYLVPTFSHTAYTNFEMLIGSVVRHKVTQPDGSTKIVNEDLFHPSLPTRIKQEFEFLGAHPELGKGTYRKHTDGSNCQHASQKHPNMMMKITGNVTKFSFDTFFIDWLHAANIDVDIITDDLLQKEGVELLKDYKAIINGSHPEYYTIEMFDAVSEYLDQGGRWMYLGGNGYCWASSCHNELDGVIEVRSESMGPDIKYWAKDERVNEFDGQGSGLWIENSRSAHQLVGVNTQGMAYKAAAVGYERKPDSYDQRVSFIFEGIGDELIGNFGLLGGGAAGIEVDTMDYSKGTPSHALLLASSADYTRPWTFPGGFAKDEWTVNFGQPQADIVFFETRSGGAVFSVGSMSWFGALSHNNYNNNIAQVTRNVLERFMDDTPFPMPKLDT